MRQRGWTFLPNGDIWTRGENGRPIAYRVADKWMIAGARSAADLYAIADIITRREKAENQ